VRERIKHWFNRHFSDPDVLLLITILAGCVILLMWMGKILAPVLASIVFAYLLQSGVNALEKLKVPHLTALVIVYCAFLGVFLSALLFLWPLIWQQLFRLYNELPAMISGFQHFLYLLPQKFPDLLTKETVDGWVAAFVVVLRSSGKIIFTMSLASLPGIIALIVYVFLVPLMVFFFLKDQKMIINWMARFLPKNYPLLSRVWNDVDEQIGNYIRGKVIEIVIVSLCTFVVFYIFDLRYAILLSVLVGLSVLMPYIGIVIVSIPVVLVAFFQWGFVPHFAYLIAAYGLVQSIDGAILVPLLFSEVNNLHPIAIILAVLVFGSWWGFWGVFFAIPLATLVKAVIDTWPSRQLNYSTSSA
jgi:putative permease